VNGFTARVALGALVMLAILAPACKTDADCTSSCDCQQRGLCGASFNECKATRPEHCSHADVCKTFGLCSLQDGKCSAVTNDDCALSVQCVKGGACTASNGRCVR
jgi:hypothetical protein